MIKHQSTTKVNWIKEIFKNIFLKSIFPNFFLSLSLSPFVWLSGGDEFYKVLVFLISALIIFFIFCIYNAVKKKIDQKCTATFSEKILIWDTFNNSKVHFLFCNNTSKPPVLSMYSPCVRLIVFFLKNGKDKGIRKHKLPSHLTNNFKT